MGVDMTKLKLGPIAEDKPVKVTIELPGSLHRDLIAYAEALARETGQSAADPKRLIVPMLERFIATDRALRRRGGRRINTIHPDFQRTNQARRDNGCLAAFRDGFGQD